MKRSAMVRFVAFLGVLAILLGYVAYHKVPTTATGSSPAAPTVTSMQQLQNYFVQIKQNRDSLMSKEIATLQSVVNSKTVSQAAKQQATATLVQDTRELKQATEIEAVLGAHGFPLVAALVNAASVQVLVGASQLTSNQVAQIADTVTQVTGLPPQDITIKPTTGAS